MTKNSAGAISKQAKPGSRKASKTRKSARTRARILEAAARLVSERAGVDFQMAEIAERCDMSKGALYYYFRDRDAILAEIFDKSIDDFVAKLEEAVRGPSSPSEVLEHLSKVFAACVSEGGTLVFAIGHDLGGAGLLPRIESRLDNLLSMVERQLSIAREQGLVRDDIDLHFSADCMCGAFFLAAIDLIKSGTPIDAEKFADRLSRFVMLGIAVPGAHDAPQAS